MGLDCIAGHLGVSQYRVAGRLSTVSRGTPRYGHACAHTRPRHGRLGGHDTALGRAGKALGAQGVRQAGLGSSRCARGGVRGARGAQRARQAGARGRARQQARARGACGAGLAGRQARSLGAGCAAWALGAQPGRAGWPWVVYSVHSAHFRSVLTRFFPESPNKHCSL